MYDNKTRITALLSVEKRLQEGKSINKVPLGYLNKSIGNERTVIVDQKYAPLIKEAFNLYATGFYSLQSLCTVLEKRYDRYITKSYMDRILDNPFYYGYQEVHGQIYRHIYEPLIDKELFDKVQQIKGSHGKKKFKYASLPFTYRGLLRCGECGCCITAERSKGYIYYHCTQASGKHGAVWFREEEVTRQIQAIYDMFGIDKNYLQDLRNVRIFFKLVFRDIKVIGNEISYELLKDIDVESLKRYLSRDFNTIDSTLVEDKLVQAVLPELDHPILKLCTSPQSVDQIAEKIGMPLVDVQAQLFDLLLENRIEQDIAGKWRTL